MLTTLLFIKFKSKKYNYNFNKKIILTLFLLSCFPFLHSQYSNSKKTYNSNKDLFLKIKDTNNTLLLGGKIWGKVDPTEYIENPILVMTNPQFLPYLEKKYIKVYCNDQNLTFYDQHQYFNYINNECFKKKTTEEWKDIKNRLNIKYVLTISEVDLNLEMLGKNQLYNLYQIN
jgi:hypothetical protein